MTDRTQCSNSSSIDLRACDPILEVCDLLGIAPPPPSICAAWRLAVGDVLAVASVVSAVRIVRHVFGDRMPPELDEVVS